MTRLSFVGSLLIVCSALLSPALFAAPLDKSANAKIDEAINVHYLSTDFRKAEAVLKGTIGACGDRCSGQVIARAWMYIGIVRGAGLQNLTGAKSAFKSALAADPNVRLDVDLTTEELIVAFTKLGGTVGEAVQLEETGPGAAGAPMQGGMSCTPAITELETRRAVPVACRTSKPATRTVLYFKEFGASKFSQVNMGLSGSDWLGQVPCSVTDLQGQLQFYVVAFGANGENIDSFGAERQPQTVNVVESTTEAPPAYPGQAAPARCSDSGDCPPEMRGTPACPDTGGGGTGRGDKSWGASCNENSECESGLYCIDGACESPPSCEVNSDCDSGVCEGFVCKMADDWEDELGDAGSSADAPQNLISIKLGADLAAISGSDVCNPQADTGYSCFVGDEDYFSGGLNPATVRNPNDPRYEPSEGGKFDGTLAPSTIRVLLSFERIFADQFGVEVQAGLAFGGSPTSETLQLLHLAAYGKYWLSGTGKGFRLYGLVGGGLGQVDARKTVTVAELVGEPKSDFCDTGEITGDCVFGGVDAYKKLGTSFIAAGVGGFLNLGGHGPVLELQGKFMVPKSGFVLQPNIGYLLGF